jgi:tetratricopeptide (TPR) repeat protein
MNHQTSHLLELPRDASARALVCAQAAGRHEERGDYNRALESLSPFWSGPIQTPGIAGLNAKAAAAVLLRAGSLTGWIGSKRQVEGWQEAAKNLLSEAAALSEGLGDREAWLESQKHLALCYWREGAFAEARTIAQNSLTGSACDSEAALTLTLTLAMVERSEGNSAEALRLHLLMGPHVEALAGDFTKGMFHNGLGLTYKKLGELDKGIIELTAAAYYFELSGHARNRIATENNLANLLVQARQFDEARLHLANARQLARQLGDNVYLGQTIDSCAQAYLAEGNLEAALASARESVAILEKGDEQALLVDSLMTLARVLSAVRDSDCVATYVRAYELAAEKTSSACASRVLMEMFGALAGQACLAGQLTLQDAKHEFEASIIKAALQETGSRTGAALRLGVQQQTMSWILKNRHASLQPTSTRKPRRQSLMKPVKSNS